MSNKLNILYLGAFAEPGGEEEVITYLFKNTRSDLFNSYLCGPSKSKFFNKHNFNDGQILDLRMEGIFDVKSIVKLISYIKEHDIHIIHSHGSKGGLYGRVAGFLSRRKVVNIWTLHLLIEENNYTLSKVRKKIYMLMEHILNKFFTDYIVCVSEDLMKKQVQKYNYKNICTIHNGIDIEKYRNAEKEVNNETNSYNNVIKFGFVSRLSKQKGVPFLIEAVRRLNEMEKYKGRFKVDIVGTGDQEEILKSMVDDYNLNDVIIFHGFVSNVPEMLSNLDVVVLPSLFEGFPMIVLESMCSITPLIASNVNGIPEVIDNNRNGFLVEPGDIDGIVKSMILYIDNPQLIRVHGIEGNKLITEKFSKEKMLEKHIHLYNSLAL